MRYEMRCQWILLAVLGIATAAPLDVQFSKIREALNIEDVETRNSALENILLDLIESLREVMLTGTEDIPVLDPLYVENISIDDELLPAIPGIEVSLSGLSVTNLSTFLIDSLSLNMVSLLPQRYRLEMEGYIPNLNVEVANYNMDLFIFGGEIFGNGDARIAIIEPRITANILIAPRISIINGIFIQMAECNIKFSLGGFEPEITGMMGGDEFVNEFVNLFIKNLIPELVEFFEDDISQFLSATVMEVGNEILADYNLGSILG